MRTVFVIDDDGLMREVLSRLLERNDYRVRAFHSPHHALPLIDADYPYAIVSDVQMPGMTGLELARFVRERGILTPIILVTGAANLDIAEEARRLGVSELFEKPIRDANRFVGAVDRAVSKREDEERTAGLDRLRLSFLTGLAHELRTPLTAIKLALENLFATRTADRLSPEGRLLAISQRNLDRIIRLVEGQLDLLQITLGDVSLSRRLVSIRDLLQTAVADTQPRVRRRVMVDHAGREERPFLFSDPDRLRAIVRYLLEVAPSDDGRPVTVRYAVDEEKHEIHLHFDNVTLPVSACAAESFSPQFGVAEVHDGTSSERGTAGKRDGLSAERSRGIAPGDAFETRAFHRIIASLGGDIRDGGAGGPCVSIGFPLSPRFDAREDFDIPIGGLREAAMLSGRSVSLLRCEVTRGARNGSCFAPEEKEFFGKCMSTLSEGDALVRGRPDGTYYLVLVERRSEEIDHITDFLQTPGAAGRSVTVSVESAAADAVPDEDCSNIAADLETIR